MESTIHTNSPQSPSPQPSTPPSSIPAMPDVKQNSSGMKDSSTVPDEIKGFSWGGFLLTWIWGIGNNTWISLLVLLPVLSFIMPFVLAFKGREWAWKNKHWNSVDHFKSTQRKWAMWGLIIQIILIGVFLFGFFSYFLFSRPSQVPY